MKAESVKPKATGRSNANCTKASQAEGNEKNTKTKGAARGKLPPVCDSCSPKQIKNAVFRSQLCVQQKLNV